jgi:hypothetical protein
VLHPLGAFSLLDLMVEYSINDLVRIVTALLRTADVLHFREPHEDADRGQVNQVAAKLDELSGLAKKIELDSSLLFEITKLSVECDASISAIVLKTRLDYILSGIQENLGTRKFIYLPREVAKFWNDPEILGEDFLIGFPKMSVFEAMDAGNCLATGRWTAAVFHLMRVAEYGLRRLAKTLHVKLTDKGKPCPIEYKHWNDVITACRNQIAKARGLPSGTKKEKLLDFYSRAADSCEYMKDIWRNEVSHSRRRYGLSEALGVLERVKEFVQPLAKTEAKKAMAKRKRLAELARSPNKPQGFLDTLGQMAAVKLSDLAPKQTMGQQIVRGIQTLERKQKNAEPGKPQ